METIKIDGVQIEVSKLREALDEHEGSNKKLSGRLEGKWIHQPTGVSSYGKQMQVVYLSCQGYFLMDKEFYVHASSHKGYGLNQEIAKQRLIDEGWEEYTDE